jgi:uncharacterized membrane protein YkvA (DUF1232 family)
MPYKARVRLGRGEMRIITRAIDWFSFPYSLILLLKHPEVSWKVKLKAGVIIAAVFFYILDPVDVIPDFTPVLGWLDDVLIVPLAAAVTARLVPEINISELRQKARTDIKHILIWITVLFTVLTIISLSALGLLIFLLIRHFS